MSTLPKRTPAQPIAAADTPHLPAPEDVAAQTAKWQAAKKDHPELYRTLLALIESREHRVPPQHARPCTTCGGPAVTRVEVLAGGWWCDFCLARISGHAKQSGGAEAEAA